jgi:methyl-accepting chemotaxis protein
MRAAVAKRNYTEATKSALFALSTKCYVPECGQPTVSFFNNEPEKKVDVAHIHAVSPNGPRWDPTVDVNAFANLILLCKFHHGKVDNKSNEDVYPANKLRRWKTAAERDIRAKIDGLDRLTEAGLEAMLDRASDGMKEELTAAIDSVREINMGAADLLQAVLDKLSNQFIDTDAIALLDSAAHRLRNLEDNATLLGAAASKLEGLEGNAGLLSRATGQLAGVEHKTAALERAADAVASSAERASDVSAAVDSIHDAGTRVIYQIQLAASSIDFGVLSRDANRWKFFAAGVIVAAVVAIAVTVLQIRLGS